MPKTFYILVINPGSTSTKVAFFKNEEEVISTSIHHSRDELQFFRHVIEQKEFRLRVIEEVLLKHNHLQKEIHAVVGRGGLLRPIIGGTYLVNKKMIKDLSESWQGEHASNLGGMIAYEFAQRYHVPPFIVDPVVVDEMEPLARISGHPELQRRSIFHALNQRAVAIEAAKAIGKEYHEINLIIAHLGGGISIGCHAKGKVIDVNNALNGEGPFSPERTGGLPAGQLVEYCFSRKHTKKKILRQLTGQGGMIAYLGTNDMKIIKERIIAGDKQSQLLYEAMAYQVAKEIGSLVPVLYGQVDAIVLTGGLVHDQDFTQLIKKRVQSITQVIVYPGEREMLALAKGALRVLTNKEKYQVY